MKLGKKRNTLNKLAKGEYIIFFDDNDYYCEDKIKNTIMRMIGNKSMFPVQVRCIYITDTKPFHYWHVLLS